ncbi:DUF3748 domain-containing protein [Sphingobacterium suaedae]|uniref:DUF3748 domain-containing protein n=1 Tax=Sphingobacterium suaedae TaxID=1686402 RepID=A0ABW5KME6_9SPHI
MDTQKQPTRSIVTLTHTPHGHTLHHNRIFSKDGQWLVFDGRNEETKIGETSLIGMVHVRTGEERVLYTTDNPSLFGPGVGAASFSPTQDRVVFIHGLVDADETSPYAIGRRTGVAVDIEQPQQPIYLDARDVSIPYTAGTLRGGTHGHCWSGDGRLLSFTYNDEQVEPDLRVVGVLVPSEADMSVDEVKGNQRGTMYAAIVSDVVADPRPGSDQIQKAFDECWVGEHGYIQADGSCVPYAVAFQGNTVDKDGASVTEIFIVDIDVEQIKADVGAVGRKGERPSVPHGIRQRRLTHSGGFSTLRYWLRSSRDGQYIFALMKDVQLYNQIVRCDVLSGEVVFVTQLTSSISSPFNVDQEGVLFVFVVDNKIVVFDYLNDNYIYLTDEMHGLVGAPSFSPDGTTVVFNQFVRSDNGHSYIQIKQVSC